MDHVAEIRKIKAINTELLEALHCLFNDWLTLSAQDANDGNKDVINITQQVQQAIDKATKTG